MMSKPSDNAVAKQEFTKLQAQLHQSVHNTLTYLDALKHSLGEYDHKHHLHHSTSATSFFSDGLDHAKDAVKELRHAVDHSHENTGTAEIRRAMEQTFNALADLHKVANAYDTEHPISSKHNGKQPSTSETVMWLVSTTRDANFTGFALLQKQLVEVQMTVGEVERPSIKARAFEVVHNVTSKLEKMRAEHS